MDVLEGQEALLRYVATSPEP